LACVCHAINPLPLLHATAKFWGTEVDDGWLGKQGGTTCASGNTTVLFSMGTNYATPLPRRGHGGARAGGADKAVVGT